MERKQQIFSGWYLLMALFALFMIQIALLTPGSETLSDRDFKTGAQDDLQRATDLPRHMVTRFGMSERIGCSIGCRSKRH